MRWPTPSNTHVCTRYKMSSLSTHWQTYHHWDMVSKFVLYVIESGQCLLVNRVVRGLLLAWKANIFRSIAWPHLGRWRIAISAFVKRIILIRAPPKIHQTYRRVSLLGRWGRQSATKCSLEDSLSMSCLHLTAAHWKMIKKEHVPTSRNACSIS